MLLIDFLSSSLISWLSVAAIAGLLVGSFINVVIYRLPLMMQREWHQQCAELNQQRVPPTEKLTLSLPHSHCRHCAHPLSFHENIPVISYLLLKGKCRHCHARISMRYPLVELLTSVLSVVVAYHYGLSWAAIGGLILTWALIALAFIDQDHQLLPDDITLPLLWLGLVFNLFSVYTDLQSSVIGAMAGYLSLWLIFHLFRLITGKEAMGHGDFKLLGVLGAWLGWQFLPFIIFLSSATGAILAFSLIGLKRHKREEPIPFGPYLAIAGWLTLIFGTEINRFYPLILGIH